MTLAEHSLPASPSHSSLWVLRAFAHAVPTNRTLCSQLSSELLPLISSGNPFQTLFSKDGFLHTRRLFPAKHPLQPAIIVCVACLFVSSVTV